MERKNKKGEEKIIFFASKLFGNHKNQAHHAGWHGLHLMRKLNLLVCFLRNEKVKILGKELASQTNTSIFWKINNIFWAFFLKEHLGLFTSDGSGSKILTGLGKLFMFWVWIWKISLKNIKFFNFFPSGQKNPLRSGRSQLGLFFTAGQK